MKMSWAAALALAFMAAPAFAQAPQPVVDFSGLVEKLRPSVVALDITTNASSSRLPLPPELGKFFSRDEESVAPREQKAAGSGFVFDAVKGLIVTTDYVLNDAVKVEVVLADAAVREAQVVGVDKPSGIGLLRIAPEGLVDLAWSDRPVRAGEPTLGLGAAYGIGVIATTGIVAAADAEMPGADAPDEVFLLDLRVHKGSAGGLVVDQAGKVIGMMMGQYGTGYDPIQNVGVGIPAAEIQRIASILVRDGKVERGAIGVAIQHELARGVIVTEVVKGSPAERAGVKVGDIVRSAGGQTLNSDRALTRLIARQRVGATVPMMIERNGRTMDLSVRVDPRTGN